MLRAIRRWVRNYFGFTRNQTNGFLLFIPAMLIILFSEPIFEWLSFRNQTLNLEEQAIADSVVKTWENEPTLHSENPEVQRFQFDPNTASADELEALGFRPFVARRIVTYREKGGRFFVKTDLLKIYGIDSATVNELIPFIQLPEELIKASPTVKSTKEPTALLDLNLADTAQLKAIRGIGPVLSARIVKYRSSLGGFINTDQLFEVWGLDSAVVDRIKQATFLDSEFEPSRMNINTAEAADLSRHPYISKKIADAIVTYRFQHGSFSDIRDLDRIDQLDKALLAKLQPYLTVK